jgi:hypothetical protein
MRCVAFFFIKINLINKNLCNNENEYNKYLKINTNFHKTHLPTMSSTDSQSTYGNDVKATSQCDPILAHCEMVVLHGLKPGMKKVADNLEKCTADLAGIKASFLEICNYLRYDVVAHLSPLHMMPSDVVLRDQSIYGSFYNDTLKPIVNPSIEQVTDTYCDDINKMKDVMVAPRDLFSLFDASDTLHNDAFHLFDRFIVKCTDVAQKLSDDAKADAEMKATLVAALLDKEAAEKVATESKALAVQLAKDKETAEKDTAKALSNEDAAVKAAIEFKNGKEAAELLLAKAQEAKKAAESKERDEAKALEEAKASEAVAKRHSAEVEADAARRIAAAKAEADKQIADAMAEHKCGCIIL